MNIDYHLFKFYSTYNLMHLAGTEIKVGNENIHSNLTRS